MEVLKSKYRTPWIQYFWRNPCFIWCCCTLFWFLGIIVCSTALVANLLFRIIVQTFCVVNLYKGINALYRQASNGNFWPPSASNWLTFYRDSPKYPDRDSSWEVSNNYRYLYFGIYFNVIRQNQTIFYRLKESVHF